MDTIIQYQRVRNLLKNTRHIFDDDILTVHAWIEKFRPAYYRNIAVIIETSDDKKTCQLNPVELAAIGNKNPSLLHVRDDTYMCNKFKIRLLLGDTSSFIQSIRFGKEYPYDRYWGVHGLSGDIKEIIA